MRFRIVILERERDEGIVFHKHMLLLSARHAIQYCCGGVDKGHSISQTRVVTFSKACDSILLWRERGEG